LDVEERLERLERLLVSVVERLRRIESMLEEAGINEEALGASVGLVASLSLPASAALEAARRSISTLRRLEGIDPISRALVEVLSECRPLTISEATRRVRLLRGTASRRIVRERLQMLERRGAVVNLGDSTRPRYVLRKCVEEHRSGGEA
jgi:hypothetical protein